MTVTDPRQGIGQLLTILASMTLVTIGMISPMATVNQAFLPENTYSIAGGVIDLFREGDLILGVIIFSFSILFPLGKLAMLLWYYVQGKRGVSPLIILPTLEFLGKWSMLDVFVLAITYGAANLGVLSEVEIQWGIYCFGFGVILSIVATLMLAWSLDNRGDYSSDSHGSRLLHALGLLFFLAGVLFPLAKIEKWIFWQQEYSVLTALRGLVVSTEYVMPLILFCFVLLLPGLHFLLAGMVRWMDKPSGALQSWARFVEKWAMFDVYALAMLLVFIKISDSAEVQLLPGFWALGIAGVVSLCDRARTMRARQRS